LFLVFSFINSLCLSLYEHTRKRMWDLNEKLTNVSEVFEGKPKPRILNDMECHNLSFGLATKGKGFQGCGPRESPGVTSHTSGSVGKCEGVNLHTPKATPTLRDGVPVDSRNFREQFQGSKLNGLWRFFYIIGKLLERRCLKWARIAHLDI